MNETDYSEPYSLTLIGTIADVPAIYSLEVAAGLAGLHPEMLRYYCRLGLLGEPRARPGADLRFDDNALYELSRFERYRRQHRVDRQTMRLICALRREVDRLQEELRFLRRP